MYAKLFSRITESSLMEQDIPTRYVFVMLLAIADPQGYVIGTDVALARRFNVPLDTLKAAVAALSSPDPDSNSPELEGRRIVPSDGERGYRLVNFLKYRGMRDEDARREYQRIYRAKYRADGRDKACQHLSTSVNICQHLSTSVNICQHLSTSVNICQHLSTKVNQTNHSQPKQKQKQKQKHTWGCRGCSPPPGKTRGRPSPFRLRRP